MSLLAWNHKPLSLLNALVASDPFFDVADRWLAEPTFLDSALAAWPSHSVDTCKSHKRMRMSPRLYDPLAHTNLLEVDGNYVVTADLPGVDLADLEVSIDDKLLTIKAERKWDYESDGGNHRDSTESSSSVSTPENSNHQTKHAGDDQHHDDKDGATAGSKKSAGRYHQQRYYGKAERTFRLPQNSIVDGATTTLKNGVLTIKIPKVKEATATTKRILEIRSE